MSPPIEIETGPDPRAAVIVLHGLGADGSDFEPIARMIDLSPVGPVRWVLPSAPMRPVTANGGYVMRAWYDILGFGGRSPEDEVGLRASRDRIDALLERERSRGVPSRRTVLAGFSQGCAMALLTGLRHPEPLAGIVGLSGYLPLADATEAERSEANRRTPVLLAHGSADPVVSIERGRAARDRLRALDQPVDWLDYPIEHTVSLPEVEDVGRWLLERIGAGEGA